MFETLSLDGAFLVAFALDICKVVIFGSLMVVVMLYFIALVKSVLNV